MSNLNVTNATLNLVPILIVCTRSPLNTANPLLIHFQSVANPLSIRRANTPGDSPTIRPSNCSSEWIQSLRASECKVRLDGRLSEFVLLEIHPDRNVSIRSSLNASLLIWMTKLISQMFAKRLFGCLSSMFKLNSSIARMAPNNSKQSCCNPKLSCSVIVTDYQQTCS